ncbi:MAG: type II toxin-antitoxin system VapC family toxin [Pseudomonadota bacterium]
MIDYVLDASALLALVNRETAAEKVAEVLPQSMMSSVSVSECVAVLSMIGMPHDEIEDMLFDLVPHVEDFTVEQALEAAYLRKITKSKGLSLGDRACIALGKTSGKIVITADKIWDSIDCGVKIKVIR